LEPLAARHLLPGPIAPDLTTSSTDR
jgi:hypothetical protein